MSHLYRNSVIATDFVRGTDQRSTQTEQILNEAEAENRAAQHGGNTTEAAIPAYLDFTL